MNKFSLYFACLLLLWACSDRGVSEVLIEYEKLSPVDFFSPAHYSNVKYVSLDSSTTLLGDNLHLKIIDDCIYIFDQQQSSVLTYNSSNGALINCISRLGRGPGEYIFIKDFYIDNNKNIILLCDPKPKVIKYNQSGNFISETPLSFNGLSFTKQNNNYWFYKDRIHHDSFNNNTIVKTDSSFQPISSYLPLQETLLGGFSEMNFSNTEDGDILFKHVFDNSVYKIHRDTIIPVYKIDWGTYKYPESFLNSKIFTEAYNILSTTTTASILAAFENNSYLLLYIAEEGVNNNFGYFLYNRKTGEILFQKFKADHLIINKLGPPKALTNDNAIIFIANAQSLKELASAIPSLSWIPTENDNLIKSTNYILVKFYLK